MALSDESYESESHPGKQNRRVEVESCVYLSLANDLHRVQFRPVGAVHRHQIDHYRVAIGDDRSVVIQNWNRMLGVQLDKFRLKMFSSQEVNNSAIYMQP